MRISDGSSDVCSSDLRRRRIGPRVATARPIRKLERRWPGHTSPSFRRGRSLGALVGRRQYAAGLVLEWQWRATVPRRLIAHLVPHRIAIGIGRVRVPLAEEPIVEPGDILLHRPETVRRYMEDMCFIRRGDRKRTRLLQSLMRNSYAVF